LGNSKRCLMANSLEKVTQRLRLSDLLLLFTSKHSSKISTRNH
jgi:hypothetical protein